MRERKWKNILSQLTEGVLILETNEEEQRPKVFFSNSALTEIIQEEENKYAFKKDF